MTGSVRGTEKKMSHFSLRKRREGKKYLLELWSKWELQIMYVGALAAAVVCVYIFIRPPAAEDVSAFRIDQPSPRVVNAPFEFDFTDEAGTKERQDQEEALVSPRYNTQPDNLTAMLGKAQALSKAMREMPLEEGQNREEWAQAVLQQAGISLKNRTYEVSDNTPENAPKTAYDSLAFYRKYDTFWSTLLTQIQAAAGHGPNGIGLIADDVTPLATEEKPNNSKPQSPTIMVGVIVRLAGGQEITMPTAHEIKSPERFFQRFQQLFSVSFPDPAKDYAANQLANDIVRAVFVGPTLLYDKALTEKFKQEARQRVATIVVHVNKDETIVGKNEIVTAKDLQKLQALQAQMRLSPPAELGYFILALFFVIILLGYYKAYYSEIARDTRKISVIFLSILMIFALTRVYAHLSLLDLGSNTLKKVGFGVPMGALGVILTMLAGARLATFSCTLSSIYMGIIQSGNSNVSPLSYVLVAVLTACGAIYTVTRIRQRSDLYRAGGVVIILAGLLIIALTLQQSSSFEQLILRVEELKWALIWGAAVNGCLVSILSIALLPIFEDLYGITTDMKLLELGQKNGLLQRLEQEAPGSYQHSMSVATLAETAAEAIGANALLTRVGCYYHDIGKTVKPQYFVENQQTYADKAKHSKLSPNMSCLIIRNHVKNGLELAKEYKLPQVIADFIPEHHGTTLLSYFYYEALSQQETEGTVKEEDFRYPGPKPQSKETAIAMLADALEAASRVLETGAEREVRQLVRKVINERFMDGQFDECNLTLKDLHTLFLSFSDSIIHMLHQRIVYPTGPTLKEKEKEEEVETRNGNSHSEKDEPPSAFRDRKEIDKNIRAKEKEEVV